MRLALALEMLLALAVEGEEGVCPSSIAGSFVLLHPSLTHRAANQHHHRTNEG